MVLNWIRVYRLLKETEEKLTKCQHDLKLLEKHSEWLEAQNERLKEDEFQLERVVDKLKEQLIKREINVHVNFREGQDRQRSVKENT